jgi:hypothetical protein
VPALCIRALRCSSFPSSFSFAPLFLSTGTDSPRCKHEIFSLLTLNLFRSLYGHNDGDWLHGTRGASVTGKLVRGCTGEYILPCSYS